MEPFKIRSNISSDSILPVKQTRMCDLCVRIGFLL